MAQIVYGNEPETRLYSDAKLRKAVNHVLLGTRLDVLAETDKAYHVDARGRGQSGWVNKKHVRSTSVFKIFFLDVGQGDGAIIESPLGIILLDGGPSDKYHHFMKHRYKRLIQEHGSINIQAMVMSHPDWDHFNGLTPVLKDKHFHIGHIYHNGIIRYKNTDNNRNTKIGSTQQRQINGRTRTVLTETYDTLSDVKKLVQSGNLMSSFGNFWQAALDAKQQGRLKGAKCLNVHHKTLPGYGQDPSQGLRVDVLGPIPLSPADEKPEYMGFPNAEDFGLDTAEMSESHTINGHSLVLKFSYGKHSFLLGGDLNIPAQWHLLQHYGDANPFRVDVAKACHHGSSDYLVDFLKRVRPMANVISSGDNKSFDHPMADAMGAIGKHCRGNHPLMFSTELARAENNGSTHYGLINLRSNGKVLTMAQMKEQHDKADVWDSYTLPWNGKFHAQIKQMKKVSG
ncbi:MAG: hypothetical protein OEZ68_11535 [Gammaproteobacteria bacterium]|nr:hypothetical protein [Gammaproteobacteria bacterium]MDH5801425.1 hypothetical protein [Gammaproteobacteria bacterium]